MAGGLDALLQTGPGAAARVMGVLNVTPDSFSDGGKFLEPHAAAERAKCMAAQGAEIIDIGAESTRPGAGRVDPRDQIARLDGILQAVVQTGAVVSIDTTRSEVAQWALDRGAVICNDISAGRDDPEMLALAARRGAAICLMHMLGQPANMQDNPTYAGDVVEEVCSFLIEAAARAVEAGIPAGRVILDPGIGFGKRLEHNLALLAGVARLVRTGHPVLIGPSRKRFISELTGQAQPQDRLGGTIAACLAARAAGATIFRVHDVAAARQALTVADAIAAAGS
ncbi:MAG: dihydropteroate synthase [Phycisphaerae bacterium]